jgi:hypothetical protein
LAPALSTVSKPADGRLAAILTVWLAERCLSKSKTSQSVTGGLRGVRMELRPLLGIELWVVEILLLGIEVVHR